MSEHAIPEPLRATPTGPPPAAAPSSLVDPSPDFRRAERMSQITHRADLANMTPAEIVQAHADGNLDYLLGR
ncbi:hypothetical protein [Nocardia nova]|uniref:hypothetical protein n=1 Tax=Nocardia nova TaxID=37330 RepID=UPI0011B0B053|nr:hypothetical protein [Nocardia nova]